MKKIIVLILLICSSITSIHAVTLDKSFLTDLLVSTVQDDFCSKKDTMACLKLSTSDCENEILERASSMCKKIIPEEGVEGLDNIRVVSSKMSVCLLKDMTTKLKQNSSNKMASSACGEKLLCPVFIKWSNKERLGWAEDLDVNTIFPSIKKELSLTKTQSKVAYECLKNTRNLFIDKYLLGCKKEVEGVAVFTSIVKSRVKACTTKAISGKLDQKWLTGTKAMLSKKAFCPDWKAWDSDKRNGYMQKNERSMLRVIDHNKATATQQNAFRNCATTSRTALIKRLDSACKTKVSYQDSINIIATQSSICIRQAGINIK